MIIEKSIKTLKEHTNTVSCVVVTPDKYIMSGSYDSTIRLWSSESYQCQHILNMPEGDAYNIAFIPEYDENKFITISQSSESVIIFNHLSGIIYSNFRKKQYYLASITCFAILPNGNIVIGDYCGGITIFDPTT